MLACQCDKTFCKSDEADAESALIDDGFDCVFRSEIFTADPELAHQQRKLLLERCLLEIVSLAQLLGSNVENIIEPVEEFRDPRGLVIDIHTFYRDTDNVDCRETEVASSDGSLRPEPVFENSCTAAHCSYLMDISLRVVSPPLGTLVERRVKVQEVREETPCRYFTCEPVEVVVRVGLEITYPALLLPDLYRENGGGAIADTLVCGVEDFTDYAASFRGNISAIVYRTEHDLISSA